MRGRLKASSAVTAARTGARPKLLFAAFLALALTLALSAALAGASKGVLTYFGSEGTGDGQFMTPRGVAVNQTGAGGVGAGDVYVVDSANNRIERFDSAGVYQAQFGSPGSGPGQLSEPGQIAIDHSSGAVYVTERANLRVQKFDAVGNFLAMWGKGVNTGTSGNADLCTAAGAPTDVCGAGTAGALGGQLATIPAAGAGIAVAPSGAPNAGNVLVADPGNRRVQEFTSAGAFLRAFGADVDNPSGGTAFEECTVAANCKIAGASGTGAGQFATNQPTRLAEDSTGAIYALESLRVQKFIPQVGPPALNALGAFDAADLTGTAARPDTDIAIGAADAVFVVKSVPGATSPPATCPSGSASLAERRVIEVSSAGALVDAQHMACASINSVNGLALDTATGRIYVSSTSFGHRVYVLDDIVPAAAAMNPITTFDAHTATLSGSVDPNGSEATYRFEYSSDGFATTATAPNFGFPSVGAGESPVPVSQSASFLTPNTTYEVRLRVRRPFGAGPDVLSAPVSFTTAAIAPGVGVNGSGAGATKANLAGWVNPNNQATTYHFEYGPADCSSNPCTALPDHNAGAGTEATFASHSLTGLTAGTTYHYRLVATNGAGTTQGPDRTILTSTGLPDGRVYEMVSPPDKSGNDVAVHAYRTRAAADGSAVGYVSLGAFGELHGTGIGIEYMAVRGNERWATHGIVPPTQPVLALLQGPDTIYSGEFSDDLSTGVVKVNPTDTLGNPLVQGVPNLYLRDDLRTPGAGSYDLITDCQLCAELSAPLPVRFDLPPVFDGASADFSHVIFESLNALTADAPDNGEAKLYESDHGTVRLVGLVPSPPDTECGGGGPACVPATRSVAGQGLSVGNLASDTISDEGSRIYFTDTSNGGTTASGTLYLRENGTTTTLINSAAEDLPDPEAPARFWASSADGSKMFFTSAGQLYRYDLDEPVGQRITLVSHDDEPADGGAAADGLIGISQDGTRAYFLSSGQLVPGAPAVGSGGWGIYAWHEGEISYIGERTAFLVGGDILIGDLLAPNVSRVTPDGKTLVFTSREGAGLLTGYDNADSSVCPNGPDLGCQEVYVYRAEANGGEGELACASCNPSGAPATTDAYTRVQTQTGGMNTTSHASRVVSDDGRYVFFSTAERLVPHDTNGTVDAYVYDTVSGQQRLLSSGQSRSPSYFLDASSDGSDAFFVTREHLSGWDFDGSSDLYDARVGGGLPEPPPPPPSCQGDACQPPPVVLNDPTPSSASFAGAGNPAAVRTHSRRACRKGRKRRGAKCVVKAKHHKKKNAKKKSASSARRSK